MIAINEIFATVQGEGVHTGLPSVFIRLQGCPVGCPWCDTKHTWPQSALKKVPWDVMVAKTLDAPTWAEMEPEHVVEVCERMFPPRHFVITGGEPCAQDIYALTVQLGRLGKVQIETSGTHPIRVAADAWVTVSPKIGMPGGFEVLADALDRADEIKLPVETLEDIVRLRAILTKANEPKVSLQPVSTDVGATALCIEQCVANNWRLSLQTHKFAGVR